MVAVHLGRLGMTRGHKKARQQHLTLSDRSHLMTSAAREVKIQVVSGQVRTAHL